MVKNERRLKDRRKNAGRREEDILSLYPPQESTQFKLWLSDAIHHILKRFNMSLDDFKKFVMEMEEDGNTN
jgi:hypothetical protein